MAGHTPTGTVHIEDLLDDQGEPTGQQIAVSTVVCSCGHRAITRHEYTEEGDETIAETASWDAMSAHLGHDPRGVPVGSENPDPDN